MKYASKNEDSNSRYEDIPFVYNLSGASIEEKFAYIVKESLVLYNFINI